MTEELERKIENAIRFLKSVKRGCNHEFNPPELAYSGGKDSDVILELARMAHIELFYPIYRNTTIDPPSTIKHVLSKGVEIKQPKIKFIELIEKKGFPTRDRRFCCEYLKEYQIRKHVILGIRRNESISRQKRYLEPQQCKVIPKKKIDVRQYFPILDWTNDDIAEFGKERNIKFHPLYYDKNGLFHPERRLGCMGCPLASQKKRIESFIKYPKMVKLYCRYGQKFLNNHSHKYFGKNVYDWFCFELFCQNLEDFFIKFKGKGILFNDGVIDCKEYLENYFNIKLP